MGGGANPGKWVSGLRRVLAPILILLSQTHSSFAARIGPPLDDEAPAFRLSTGASTLLEIPFRFHPTLGPSHPPVFLRGARAKGASFLASEWSVAPPDRDDRFSVRWQGYWAPGEIECEIRLRADESATFYLDGRKALECVEGATGSTGTFSLDWRVHQLRVDYSERTGDAFVRLEWKLGDAHWKPLVASVDRKKENTAGWNADYYLGENFETKSFSRIDPTLDFDWGDEGPFDRPEDVPTLAWRIVNDEEGRTFGEISANREGILALGLVLASTSEGGNASLSFSNPLLQFSSGNGETVSVQFDRESSNFSIGAEDPGEGATESGRLEFSLRVGDSIRFWETGGTLSTGAQVAGALESAEREYERTRPRLSGEWSRWDEEVSRTGSWRLQVLADRDFSPNGKAFDRLARLVAPDLLLGEGPVSEEPETDIAELTEALEGLNKVETRIAENPEGGLDLQFAPPLEGEYRFDNLPLGNDQIDIQGGPRGIRIENGGGMFLSFDSPGTVTGFRIDDAGNWTGEAHLGGPATLRAGPAERISGVLWNEVPLLLVREGDRFSARLPGARGSLRVLSRKE